MIRMTETTSCRSCRAPIRFVSMTGSRRAMPVNAEPNAELGSIEIMADGLAQALTGEALWNARQAGRDLYVSHFATCPRASSFRRRR